MAAAHGTLHTHHAHWEHHAISLKSHVGTTLLFVLGHALLSLSSNKAPAVLQSQPSLSPRSREALPQALLHTWKCMQGRRG